MKKTLIIFITVVLGLALAYQGRKILLEKEAQEANASRPAPMPLKVRLQHGHPGEIAQKIPVLARLASQREIQLSTKLAGYIQSIEVNESQPVHKGDLLIRIDDREIRSALKSQESALRARIADRLLAQKIWERNLRLYRAGGLAKETLDASKTALENKKALEETVRSQIAQLNNQLRYLQITAPFDGTVDRILMHEGDLAAVSRPILKLQSRTKRLLFTFPMGTKIRPGQPIYHQSTPIGRVQRLYPSASAGLPEAEAILDHPMDLPVGTTLKLHVETGRMQGCIFSSATLLHKTNGLFQMRLGPNGFHAVKITPLLLDEKRVLLKECPEEPAAIASETSLSLLPGHGKVSIIQEQSQ